MKKKFLLVLSFVVLFLGISFRTSFAQEYVEQIKSFVTDVTFNQDATIDVKEEIHYYFPYERHGIYREIPIDYRVTGSFKRSTKLKLNNLYYYPADNTSLIKDSYSTSFRNGYRIYQIGEEDTYIQGDYVYVLDYTLTYAVNYFDDHDELYLNLSGDSWEVPIASAYADIHLPAEAQEAVCYTGEFGSTQQNCKIEYSDDKQTLRVSITEPLDTYEGYTVAVKLPLGSIENTEDEQRIQWILSNIGIFLPIPVLIFLIPWVKKNGKNKKLTVIPHYHAPKDLTPTLSGFLYTKRPQNKYLTANLIDLAVRGYLKIKQISKRKYELVKTDKAYDGLDDVEQELLDGIFKKGDTVEIDKISSTFYRTVNIINAKINKQVYEKELFSKERKKKRNTLLTIGILLSVVLVPAATFLIMNASTGWLIGLVGTVLILFISAGSIDLRGKKGNEVYHELLGLRMYIDTAEKKRIEFHNDPEKFRGIFEKLLPYAMIFGLEKKWAGEFKDLYDTPPDWYVGNMNTFDTYMMTRAFTRMNSAIQSKSVQPGSKGGFRVSGGASGGSGFSGGSSGGGFGGGGGGSW
jgi:hypothetical protein